MKFELGQVVSTCGIANTMEEHPGFRSEVMKIMLRYMEGDWGDTCKEDKPLNDDAVKSGEDRILAAYETSQGKIWIQTEWDRSYTTIMFPDEY